MFLARKKPDFRATEVIKQQRQLCQILGGAALVAAGGMGLQRYDANGGGGGDRRRRTIWGTRRRWKRWEKREAAGWSSVRYCTGSCHENGLYFFLPFPFPPWMVELPVNRGSTHNPLMRAQGKPTFSLLMRIHKDWIANAIIFESNFGGGQHVRTRVTMGKQKSILHSNTVFIPSIKTGCTPAYPLNPTHGAIAVADRQYKKNVYDYQLVKNMNSNLKKIFVAATNEKCIKVAKDMVMGYTDKSFVYLMDWIYARYVQITTV